MRRSQPLQTPRCVAASESHPYGPRPRGKDEQERIWREGPSHFDPRPPSAPSVLVNSSHWSTSPWPISSDDRLLPWTERLRVLLPDSGGAASARRRQELWQRMGCGEEAEYETLELFLLNLVLNSAIIPTSLASSGQLLFLGAGLYAASDEVAEIKSSSVGFVIFPNMY